MKYADVERLREAVHHKVRLTTPYARDIDGPVFRALTEAITDEIDRALQAMLQHLQR